VLRRIFALSRDEGTGGWRKLHEELHNLYFSPNINGMIKSKMTWIWNGRDEKCIQRYNQKIEGDKTAWKIYV
jgi:hypothetical protein